MKITINSWYIFLQFIRRDFIVRKRMFRDNIINYTLIYPVSLGFQTAYLQASSYFGSGNREQNTILFAGNIILVMMLFTYKQNIELLFDFENKRYIDYQITLLNPFLVLIERILFTGVYTFFMMLPFYPIAGLMLSGYIDMSHAAWLKIFIILGAGSFCLSAYHLLAACLLKNSSTIATLWNRANNILMTFGGFWIPWFIIAKYSPLLGFCVYFNPCIYITEGIKGAITGNPNFLSFWLCLPMLLLFTLILTLWCWHAFKKRTDCL